MFSIIWMLIVGVIVGALARLILPGRDPMGIFMTMLLGVVGSIVGGLIGRALFGPSEGGGFLNRNFLLSLIGAILLLWIWRMFRTSSSTV